MHPENDLNSPELEVTNFQKQHGGHRCTIANLQDSKEEFAQFSQLQNILQDVPYFCGTQFNELDLLTCVRVHEHNCCDPVEPL